MSFHNIHSDGMSVRASYRGFPPFPLSALLISFFVCCFGLVALELAWQQLAPKLDDNWYLKFDWWWRILVYFAIFGAIPLGIAILGMRMLKSTMSESFRFMKRAVWDSGRGEFSYISSSMLGFVNSRTTMKLTDIVEIFARYDDELEDGNPKPLVISVCGDVAHELELVPAKPIKMADAEAIVFAIARLCGLTHYNQREGVEATRIHAHTNAASDTTAIPFEDSQAATSLFPQKSVLVATLSGVLNNLVSFAVALFLGCLGGFLVWGVWTQGKMAEEQNLLAEQIEATGAEVTQAGLKIGDVSVFGGGFVVEIKDSDFDDSDLRKLIDQLAPIGFYGLDLSNTSVTDEGVKLFQQLSSLRFVNLSGTLVTPKMMPFLAKSQLGAIDLRSTPIRIEHIDDWNEFYALEVLFIDDDDVTTEDIWKLDSLPRLEAILVNDKETTNQLFAPINAGTGRTLEDSDRSELGRQRAIDAFSVQTAGDLRYDLN